MTTHVVDVASPLRARSVLHAGDSATGTSLGGAAWSETQQYLVHPDGSTVAVEDVAPQLAGPSWALSVALDFAGVHGLAAKEGTTSVDGRACRLWRTFEPVDAGPLRPATGGDSALSCVTAGGVLVQDAWTIKGDLVRRRTLTSKGIGPSLAGNGLFAGQAPTPVPSGQPPESVKEVGVPTLVTALGIPVPAAPLGLPAGRSVAIIQADPSGAGIAVEGGVFSWYDGDRAVILRIERGLTRPLSVGSAGVALRAGARTVRVQAVASGLTVRFAGPAGLVATVTANVPADQLLAWVGTIALG